MDAKAFLLEECKNVERLLDQTLRHEYGLDGSQDFYDECFARLKFIESQIAAASNPLMLASCGLELNGLTKLICRIERSSLGEYSWPFVEELKKIASAICIEASLSGESSKIYVLADGGLDKYEMWPEPKRPSYRRRLLLTIVFPKTLKHFVLLHTILGHELGHAIWRCSKHEQHIRNDVIAKFAFSPGIFQDEKATLAHIYSAAAPQEVKDHLAVLAANGIDQNDFFRWADWDSWVEEFLCDLIGLATFGPSFVAAQCQLLPSINPQKIGFGPKHPSVAWRLNLLLRGATLLGFDAIPPANDPARGPLQTFWQNLHSNRSADTWYDVLTDAQLGAALQGIKALLDQYPPSVYPHPDSVTLFQLLSSLKNGVPPVGFALDEADTPKCSSVDFRQIIYAGWVASQQGGAAPFDLINRLCEHAIMQQRAIDIHMNGTE